MAITNLSLVNQKLAYVRALLKMAHGLVGQASTDDKLILKALTDGAAFHLACGYRHYLHELAEQYRVKNFAVIQDEVSLLAALNELEKQPSEAAELIELRNQSSSWLFELQNYYASIWAAASPDLITSKSIHENLIPSLALDGGIADVDSAIVSAWLNDFEEVIARHRETTTEY